MRRVFRSIFILFRRGLAVLALLALLVAGLRAVQATLVAARLDVRLTQPVDDPVSAALARLAAARVVLEQANVTRGPIGYVGRRSETLGGPTTAASQPAEATPRPAGAAFDWGALAQYALAPVVVDLAEPGPEPGAPPQAVVLANFADEAQPAAYAREHGLEVVKDLGHGLAVLRKPPPPAPPDAATKPESKPEPKQGK